MVGHLLYLTNGQTFLQMNYIDIKEAVKATGKSEKTIRRFLSKVESKPFIERKDSKLLVDVNYLFSSYPPVNNNKKDGGQRLDTVQSLSKDIDVLELKNKLALYEQELRHKDELLNEKDNRILDLQRAMLLLDAPKEQELPIEKKKRWWQF